MQNSSQRNSQRSKKTRMQHRVDATSSDSRQRAERKLSNSATRLADAKKNYEHYIALARAAASTGDAIEIENYHQHAEHYFRLMRTQQAA